MRFYCIQASLMTQKEFSGECFWHPIASIVPTHSHNGARCTIVAITIRPLESLCHSTYLVSLIDSGACRLAVFVRFSSYPSTVVSTIILVYKMMMYRDQNCGWSAVRGPKWFQEVLLHNPTLRHLPKPNPTSFVLHSIRCSHLWALFKDRIWSGTAIPRHSMFVPCT